ncbi:MAG: AtpZ/AtpI family protein [Bacteroidetes bacterium]|nr:AtpZ/AtpI family protein [Bacteroidota bacterium]
MKRSQPNFLKYTGLAFQMLLVIGIATWGGWELDQYLGFEFPLFTLLLSITSIVGLIYKLIKSLENE